MRVYVDNDGVLADFDGPAREILGMDPRAFEDAYGSDAFWEKLNSSGRFYYDLPMMPDAHFLMDYLAPLQPIVLSGSPSQIPTGHFDKHEWIKEMFGPYQPVITCQSSKKSNFCRPGDFLIDDTLKYRSLWEGSGGIFIHHTNAESTIEQLRNNWWFVFNHTFALVPQMIWR